MARPNLGASGLDGGLAARVAGKLRPARRAHPSGPQVLTFAGRSGRLQSRAVTSHSTRAAARPAAPSRPRRRTGAAALWLFLATLALYAMTASGTIASSDGTTMYLLTRALVHDHTIAIPSGNGYPGRDGRLYAKAGLGQAVVAAPFLAAGDLAAAAGARGVAFLRGKQEFVVRAVTSSLNLVLGALGVAAFFLTAIAFGAGAKRALLVATAFAVGTPQWVYAKTFLTEPLTTCCLVAGLGCVAAARHRQMPAALRWMAGAGLAWGWALVAKSAMASAVLPLVAWGVWDVWHRRAVGPGGGAVGEAPRDERLQLLAAAAVPMVACCALVLWYNAARFGSPLASGYGHEVSPESFSTPLLVGLYGLLFSSGKSVFLYAPLLLMAPAGFALMLRRNAAERPLAIALLVALAVNLAIYARFMAWGGDGSWGPRYLVPFVPLALLPVTMYLGTGQGGARATRHAVARWLTVAGLVATLGGVTIYFGSYLRAAGEYPYTREFTDPRFMADTHFNPAFSPLSGHWRMAVDNLEQHLSGHHPHVTPQTYDPQARLPVDAEQAEQLLGGFDLWWCYLWYAGGPLALGLAAAAGLGLIAALAGLAAWRAVHVT